MLSLDEILPRARLLYPNRPAVQVRGATLTFQQLAHRVDALAAALLARGLHPGDRIAVVDVNSTRYLELYYAAVRAGLVLVPVNSRLSGPEVAHILRDCGARAAVVAPPFHSVLGEISRICGGLNLVITYGDRQDCGVSYEELIASGGTAARPASPPGDAIAQIYYTSGTTGTPKGVCLTYDNLAASALDAIVGLGLTWRDTWLHAAPMFHLVDAWAIWAMPMLGAAQIPLHFTPDAFVDVVTTERPTCTALPPTLINMLCTGSAAAGADLSSIRLIMYGGSPMPAGVLERGARVFPAAGFFHAYGITETSGILTLLRPEDHDRVSSAGQPVCGVQLAVLSDTGAPAPTGEIGEIVVAGRRVMDRYWEQPAATAEAVHDGWYHTGDLGRLDAEHYLYIIDRKKDMIISGGENVYPAEVENVLSRHPGILECAVLGLPDTAWGETVHAVVVPSEGSSVTAETTSPATSGPDRCRSVRHCPRPGQASWPRASFARNCSRRR